MKKFIQLVLLLSITSTAYGQLRDSVLVERPQFTIMYSEVLEQPLWVEYKVRQIEKGADRKGMNFYKEDSYHTSDNDDYKRNVWDKGHMAPAAHFSDTEENLRATFTYLNSALQHQSLNRVEWRLLEEQERDWAEEQPLEVFIRVDFGDTIERVPGGAAIPTAFYKAIHFSEDDVLKCFYFPNTAPDPDKDWPDYEINCY